MSLAIFRRSLFLALLWTGWLCLPPTAARAASTQFTSGGRDIRVDVYFPPAVVPGRCAVLVLHGAGGMLFDGPDMRRMARHLARAGHPVYMIHYFNSTGSIVVRDAAMRRHFDQWLVTVRDAVAWTRSQAAAQGRPVAIYGYSLGAFLALAAGSNNPRVGAIAEQAGGIWYGQRDRLRRLPPVLMIHGEEDQRVPFGKFALPLLALLKQRGVVVETRFVRGQGHRFTQAAEERVRAEAARFFGERLASSMPVALPASRR